MIHDDDPVDPDIPVIRPKPKPVVPDRRVTAKRDRRRKPRAGPDRRAKPKPIDPIDPIDPVGDSKRVDPAEALGGQESKPAKTWGGAESRPADSAEAGRSESKPADSTEAGRSESKPADSTAVGRSESKPADSAAASRPESKPVDPDVPDIPVVRPQPKLEVTPRAVPPPAALSHPRLLERDPDAVTRWVEAARRGDREAFGQLYHRFAPMVHAILLARVPRSDVSDLVQDVFLRALRALDTLREANAFGAWVATMARNQAADFHRGARNVVELPADLAAPQAQHAEALAVLTLIRRLPDAYRETLMMRLVEGMTGPEIANRTGLTPGSVRVNLFRGMVMIRKWLNLPDAARGKS